MHEKWEIRNLPREKKNIEKGLKNLKEEVWNKRESVWEMNKREQIETDLRNEKWITKREYIDPQ